MTYMIQYSVYMLSSCTFLQNFINESASVGVIVVTNFSVLSRNGKESGNPVL